MSQRGAADRLEAPPRPARPRPQQAIELLIDRLKQTRSNVEFLMQVQKTTPVPGRGDDD